MSGISTKCIECGAPLELDPYKNNVKCKYCGSLNFYNNKKYINQGDLPFQKLRDYLPKLKKKKIFIPILVFSSIFFLVIQRANHIDDFLIEECQQRDVRSSVSAFVAKKNYRKCLKNIKSEWRKKLKEAKVEIKNSCKIVNQKKYKSILDEQAVFEPETDNKYFIYLEKQEIRDRLNNFEPKFTKELPWSEKFYFAEIFPVKECKKFLGYKLEPYSIFRRPRSYSE